MPSDKQRILDHIRAFLAGTAKLSPEELAAERDPETQAILRGLDSLWSRQRLLESQGREAEDALRESHRFLDSIVENLPNMVFVKDAKDLRFVRINRAGEQLLGYDRTELLGRDDHDFFPLDQAEFFTQNDRDVLAGRMLVDIPEEPIHTRKQGLRILHTKKIPILDEAGEPRYLLGLSEDITERHQAQVEIQKAKTATEATLEARNAFFAQMTHEIRTPIAGIIGLTRSLLDSSRSPGQRDRLSLIRTAADTLLHIIDDILDFSRLEAGRMTLRFQPFDLRQSVADTLRLMTFEAEKKGLPLEGIIAPETPRMVRGDRVRLRQVLINLIGNAIKFSDAGTVRLDIRPIAATEHEVRLHLAVADTGIGIEDSHRESLFKPIAHALRPQGHPGQGSGLGLAISAQLVELMQGRIWVDSTLGVGTTVHFTARFGAVGRNDPWVAGQDSPSGEGMWPIHFGRTSGPDRAPATRHDDGLKGPSPSALDPLARVALGKDTDHRPMAHGTGELASVDRRLLRVLVVEDDAVNRQAVADLLECLGHEACCVADGDTAVRALTAGRFDLVLMDLRLPGSSGLEVTRAIRALPHPARRTPVAAISASLSQADRVHCFAAGMDAYLEKPLTAPALLRTFDALLGPSSGAPEPHRRSRPETVRDAFLRTAPRTIQDLKNSLHREECEAAAELAHRLAGALANVGAKDAADAGRRLEIHARAGDLGAARNMLATLEAAIPPDLAVL